MNEPILSTCRVLLVEDDPGDAHLVRQALRAGGESRFDVVWVTTLAEARQQLSDNPPDVLLLDLSLPDSDGLDTVRSGHHAAGVLPLIVLTGHDDAGFALQTLEAGAQDYLVKGRFDADDLIRAIRYAISRGRLEQRLAETGTHLLTLINAMPDIICFKDGEGRWLEANDFDLKLFQLEGVDYRGKKDSELAAYQDFHRETFLACEASDEAAWRAGGASQEEQTISRPDALPLVFDVVKVPLFHEDGRRKGLVVVGRDITERKQAEARQRLAARVLETTGEAILVTDAEANIVAVNPAFSRITGYTEAEVLGKNPRMFNSGRHDKAFFHGMWHALLTRGEWAGEIWNRRKNGEIFPEWLTASAVRNAAGELTQFVAVFADLSEIRRAQETAEHLSWRDPLTGLANRALFLRQLQQTLADAQREERFADVLLLDLDRFKDINEARGLAIGDALLVAVAGRLRQTLQADDVLARLDSDEFAVLLPRLQADREAAGHKALAVAERLRAALLDAIELEGESIHLNVSIGIALFPESPRETASDVLRQADLAMHQAKAEGGGRAVFFEAAMGETVRDRYRLEQELRLAIDTGQLRTFLQPQVDAGGRQVGAEALVRWQHPVRGLVPPGVFIPLAESSDLIVALDRWMLAEVCRLLARLDAEGRTLRISVNISPRHFQKNDFVAEIQRLLAASGADPNHLVLEVTEGLVIGNFADVVAKMTALTALGIHFSMDDFGTGYSSLAYLKRLPIHELKIDKSFIQDAPTDPNDGALVETILAVAKHLHLQVVAEGVETRAQAEFLNARGEVIHQGYLFGRPVPVETWLARLDEGVEPVGRALT
ncbi:MAG: EAL domain-containing protein [Sulfuricella sp.]|nr:EAL domain-containing protein [Sulfuricella sp.]